MGWTLGASIAGLVCVNADPASKLHLDAGIAYLLLRIIYLLSISAICFPQAVRPGVFVCFESFCAWMRILFCLVTVVFGILMSIEAPTGKLNGRTQVAASVFFACS